MEKLLRSVSQIVTRAKLSASSVWRKFLRPVFRSKVTSTFSRKSFVPLVPDMGFLCAPIPHWGRLDGAIFTRILDGKVNYVNISVMMKLQCESCFLFRTFKPLGLLSDSTVVRIAKKHGKSPAQVCLRFLVQQGIAVIPKSVNAQRLKENLQVS